MAFDGITVAALTKELSEKLLGGRILKVVQPEKNELVFTIKNYDQFLLFISADASLPLIYLKSEKKDAPLTSPAFCMLLRKYLNNARIVAVTQPGLERIINIDIEHYDELGDLSRKRLIVELMGKHSNIIFCDESGRILDSIKRVPAFVSSVREVLPGREYFIPDTLKKLDPLDEASLEEGFVKNIPSFPGSVVKALYSTFTGISPLIANEAVLRCGLDADIHTSELTDDIKVHLLHIFADIIEDVKRGSFFPNIIYEDNKPVEFCAVRLIREGKSFESISKLLECYYSEKNSINNIKQRSTDLRRIITNLIERESKKYELQLRSLEETSKREECKLKGELLMTWASLVKPDEKEVELENYYTGGKIRIALDPNLSAVDNAKKYYERYAKLKRTFEAMTRFCKETKEVLDELLGLKLSLEIASCEADLDAIRKELVLSGFIKGKNERNGKPSKKNYNETFAKSTSGKGAKNASKPMHFVTSDGFDIYVGRNNLQNDELTFKFAENNDWWFHAKGVPGSHVILKTDDRDIPDHVFELAAGAAAFFSQNKDSEKAEVDYLLRKNVKKPAGSRPGFVVYYTNYSMVAQVGIAELKGEGENDL